MSLVKVVLSSRVPILGRESRPSKLEMGKLEMATLIAKSVRRGHKLPRWEQVVLYLIPLVPAALFFPAVQVRASSQTYHLFHHHILQ